MAGIMWDCTLLDVSQFVAEPLRTGVQRVLVKVIQNWPRAEPVMPFRVVDRSHVAILDPLIFTFMGRFFERRSSAQRGLVAIDHGLRPGATAEEANIRHIAANPLAVMPADRFFRRGGRVVNLESFSNSERSRFYIDCAPQYRQKVTHFIHDFLLFESPEVFPQLNWRFGSDNILLFQAFAAAGHFLVATEAMAEKVCRYLNRPAADVRVTGFGGDIATPEHIASVRRPRADRRRRVLMLGTIEPRKYPLIAAKALDALATRHGNTEFLVVGSWGWVSPAMRSEIAAIFSQGRVVHRAHLADDEMIALLANTDVGVYVSSAEGYGLPAIEFAALGVPVVINRAVPAAHFIGTGATILDDVTEEGLIAAVETRLAGDGGLTPYYRTTWADCAAAVAQGDADKFGQRYKQRSRVDPVACWRFAIMLAREFSSRAGDWESLKRDVRGRLFGDGQSVALLAREEEALTSAQRAELVEHLTEVVSDSVKRIYWADLVDARSLLVEFVQCLASDVSHLDGVGRAYNKFLGREPDARAAQDATRIPGLEQRGKRVTELIHTGEAKKFLATQRGAALRKITADLQPCVIASLKTPVDLFDLFQKLGLAAPTLDTVRRYQALDHAGVDRLEMLLFFAHGREARGDSLDMLLESIADVVLQRGSGIARLSSNGRTPSTASDPKIVSAEAGRPAPAPPEASRDKPSIRVVPIDSMWLTEGWHSPESVENERFRWMSMTAFVENPEPERAVLELRLDVKGIYGAVEPMLRAHFDALPAPAKVTRMPEGWLILLKPEGSDAAPVERFRIESLVGGCPARDEGTTDARELSLCVRGVSVAYADSQAGMQR